MDGENFMENPYEQMDDLGGGFYHPYFWFNTHLNIALDTSHIFGLSVVNSLRSASIFPFILHPIDQHHMSSVQNPYDIPLYWLVNRDPYNGLIPI